MAPTIVPVDVIWSAYGADSTKPSVGVTLDLGIGANNQPNSLLDKIASVYIDNTQSNVPIYVYFPSTGFTVTAPPNSSTWYPVHTFDYKANIYGVGFVTGQIPRTTIFFSNVFVPPYTDYEINQAIALWRASPNITRGTNIFTNGYSVPAVGDQIFSNNLDVFPLGANANILNSPNASGGFFYVTGISMFISGNVSNNGNLVFVVESVGPSGNLFTVKASFGSSAYFNFNVFNKENMNLKLNASELWRIRSQGYSAGGAGEINLLTLISYTLNPN